MQQTIAASTPAQSRGPQNDSTERLKKQKPAPGYNATFRQLKLKDDLVNGIKLTQRRDAFRDFCSDFKHRVVNLTDDMEKKQK